MNFVIAYFGTLVTFLIMDAIWIGVVANSFYMSQMQSFMRDNVIIAPAAIFYAMYAATIVYLVVMPNAQAGIVKIALAGAVLGIAAYGAYDMTNLSLMKNFSTKLAMVDWVWGAVVTATSATGGYYALKFFGNL